MIDLAPLPTPGTTAAGERLLCAAEELFYDRGIGAVGVDLVADTAGVTKRTLYQRFGSKGDLVRAYLERRAHRWQVELLRALAEAPADERVATVYDVASRWARDHARGCAFVNAWAELEHDDSPAARTVREEKRWMRELFGQLVESPEVADQLHLLYEGAQVIASTLPDPDAFARATQASRTLLDRTQLRP